ncbi:hypothetical protein [Mesorhizobium sp. M0410]|uniref:hypothetical protein n=1 Tax=unclassified Mesorhizobium TaxID=325217 RepID=UPI00333A8CD0
MVEVNPANGIKRLTSGNGEGFHTWEVSEIVQYEKRHARGTMARMALAIFMFTGLRLSDAAIFGRQHITQVRNKDTGTWEKWIRIKPGKTDKSKVRKEAIVVELPLLPELEDELSFAPAGNLTFLVTEYGRPFSENGLGNKMRQWCDEAGLPGCSAHGVRKAGATVAAENGDARAAEGNIRLDYLPAPGPLDPESAPSEGRAVRPHTSDFRSKRERNCPTF